VADLDAEFLAFHAANPHIYDALVVLARRARSAGRTRAGIGMLWEVLRWDIFIRTTGTEYKLNNNLRSRYARLIMHREPDLAGFFETRVLTS
jgi:hypothetical protein